MPIFVEKTTIKSLIMLFFTVSIFNRASCILMSSSGFEFCEPLSPVNDHLDACPAQVPHANGKNWCTFDSFTFKDCADGLKKEKKEGKKERSVREERARTSVSPKRSSRRAPASRFYFQERRLVIMMLVGKTPLILA